VPGWFASVASFPVARACQQRALWAESGNGSPHPRPFRNADGLKTRFAGVWLNWRHDVGDGFAYRFRQALSNRRAQLATGIRTTGKREKPSVFATADGHGVRRCRISSGPRYKWEPNDPCSFNSNSVVLDPDFAASLQGPLQVGNGPPEFQAGQARFFST